MKTPNTVLHFTQQSWFNTVKQLQRLQADFSTICKALGTPQLADCELRLEGDTLHIKTSAALATRLRHLEPELKAQLNTPRAQHASWNIQTIDIAVQRSAHQLTNHLLSNQLLAQPWVNPNQLRLGKRTTPNAEQKAVLNQFMPKRRRIA